MTHALLISVFVIATCGLVYELLAGTIASYLLGDSVTQFSTVIGAYLFSMGVGSWLSRYVQTKLIVRFVQVEILVGLIGGASAAVLFLAFAEVAHFRVVLYSCVVAVGTLVGLEIPLLLRILKDQLQFHDLVSKVLSLDYLGALAASLFFPLWLVPKLGLVRGSFLIGMANLAVALWACRVFREHLGPGRLLAGQAAGAFLLLAVGFGMSDRITDWSEEKLYADEVVFTRTSPYQRIVVTRSRQDTRLWLNGHLQFSTFDEYRYHEALVHPGLAMVERPERALVLGGGDGLAVREILRDARVKEVVLVDLDPAMTALFRDHELLSALNGGSLRSPRVRIVNEDAFVWLDRERETFDFVVVDFPDPTSFSLGKLYTTTFYRMLKARLAPAGVVSVQATSPLFARRSFWCVVATMEAAGFVTAPCHVYVPSFGEWGYVVAGQRELAPSDALPEGLRFLDAAAQRSMFQFPRDMTRVPAEPNRLNNQVLVQYYDAEWKKLTP